MDVRWVLTVTNANLVVSLSLKRWLTCGTGAKLPNAQKRLVIICGKAREVVMIPRSFHLPVMMVCIVLSTTFLRAQTKIESAIQSDFRTKSLVRVLIVTR